MRIKVGITLMSLLYGEALQAYAHDLAELLVAGFEALPDTVARSAYPQVLRGQHDTCELDEQLRRR